MLLALLLQASQAGADDPRKCAGLGCFSRSATLGGRIDSVRMTTERRASRRPVHLFTLTTKLPGQPAARFETTSAVCPVMAEVIAGLKRLRSPSITPPAADAPPRPPLLDPVLYSLNRPVAGKAGGVTWFSADTGPLARWVDASLEALKPCWRPVGG